MSVSDYEILSAYIDGELSEAERTALESRLQAEPNLQRELDSLQQTTALINQLPTLKAPRNFTLNTKSVGPRRAALPFPLTATFSALSTAAAVLLVAFGAYFLMQADTQMAGFTVNQTTMQDAAGLEMPTLQAMPTQTVPEAQPAPMIAPSMPPALEQAAESDGVGALAEEAASDMADSAINDADLSDDDPQAGNTAREIEEMEEAEGPLLYSTGENQPDSLAMRAPEMTTTTPLTRPPDELQAERVGATESNLQVAPPAAQQGTEIASRPPVIDGEAQGFDELAPATLNTSRDDNQQVLGVALAAAGIVLLLIALTTTLIRRRRQQL